ncbi:MBL fold metallo-hydrolase RNA specificity domain-containing protein [Solitalea koreensis]|uniref:Metallo-beta-lactamase family protein n=1 Tax=Solitalea koreensis TaxID=543615 RepID=A0A521D2W5_9SPHI|nr:MBL fold metallo-hydrolase [Solitalea koreensis]SMO65361.1 metallo-beta-lactamase family protein [Solitalea koreensis]
MNITFHGAAQCVTGSKHLITLNNGLTILLDCGLFQGHGADTENLNRSFGFNPIDVDILVLSHAHIDHSGLIPRLVKEGFEGKIYCTPATVDLTKILLRDSAHIQEMDVKFINKRRARQHKRLIKPLYIGKDAENCFGLFQAVEYNTPFIIAPGVELTFTDAGHIIGSAAVHLKITENQNTIHLTFSGDLGRYSSEILRSPQIFPQADYILLESTYGNRLHEDQINTEKELLRHITETCIEKGGKLIIPSFSVGRTQEILYTLNNLELVGKLPELDYFVDSPLSEQATLLLKSFPDYYNETVANTMKYDKDPFDFKGLHFIEDVEESKALNQRKEPCVIISASGMAEAGRVKHHIKNNIEDARNRILMVGYCEPQSLGGRLLAGTDLVHIFGEGFIVKASVAKIDSLSAHGDYNDLIHFLACQDPGKVKKLFLVHGDPATMIEFSARLKEKGFANVEMPRMHQNYSL